MGKVFAIIPARGGSKGIPGKNLIPICGLPLIAWSILQAKKSSYVDEVYVSSDSEEILAIAKTYHAKVIIRPESISGDGASSESAWEHAVDCIEKTECIDLVVGMQCTSTIRTVSDIDNAMKKFHAESLDSLFTANEVKDFFNWKISPNGLESVNYDYRERKRRQEIDSRYLENGSFYIFKPKILRERKNRLGGKIGMFLMEHYQMFQIDDPGDVKLCEVIMKGYGHDINF